MFSSRITSHPMKLRAILSCQGVGRGLSLRARSGSPCGRSPIPRAGLSHGLWSPRPSSDPRLVQVASCTSTTITSSRERDIIVPHRQRSWMHLMLRSIRFRITPLTRAPPNRRYGSSNFDPLLQSYSKRLAEYQPCFTAVSSKACVTSTSSR